MSWQAAVRNSRMKSIKTLTFGFFLLIFFNFALAQAPASKPATPAPTASAPPNAASNATKPATNKVPDRAAAYYHYSLAHIYEELVSSYARSEFADKAIEEYKLAIANDPDSAYLNAGL